MGFAGRPWDIPTLRGCSWLQESVPDHYWKPVFFSYSNFWKFQKWWGISSNQMDNNDTAKQTIHLKGPTINSKSIISKLICKVMQVNSGTLWCPVSSGKTLSQYQHKERYMHAQCSQSKPLPKNQSRLWNIFNSSSGWRISLQGQQAVESASSCSTSPYREPGGISMSRRAWPIAKIQIVLLWTRAPGCSKYIHAGVWWNPVFWYILIL